MDKREKAYAFHLLTIITNTTGTSNRGCAAAPLSDIDQSSQEEKTNVSESLLNIVKPK